MFLAMGESSVSTEGASDGEEDGAEDDGGEEDGCIETSKLLNDGHDQGRDAKCHIGVDDEFGKVVDGVDRGSGLFDYGRDRSASGGG